MFGCPNWSLAWYHKILPSMQSPCERGSSLQGSSSISQFLCCYWCQFPKAVPHCWWTPNKIQEWWWGAQFTICKHEPVFFCGGDNTSHKCKCTSPLWPILPPSLIWWSNSEGRGYSPWIVQWYPCDNLDSESRAWNRPLFQVCEPGWISVWLVSWSWRDQSSPKLCKRRWRKIDQCKLPQK